MAKIRGLKIMAILLLVAMMLNMLPVMALDITTDESFHIAVVTSEGVLEQDGMKVTLTNKADSADTKTVETVAGIAVFDGFVKQDQTYIISVKPVEGYDAEDAEVTISEGTTYAKIKLTKKAVKKVEVSGVVMGSDGTPYSGAKVTVVGTTMDAEMVTGSDGAYGFGTLAGEEVKITVTPKAEDVKYDVLTTVASYDESTTDANYTFQVKTFQVKTSAGENGTISDSQVDIPYGGESKEIVINAADGFRIKEVTLNGEALGAAKDQKSYSFKLADIKADHEIKATFEQKKYEVTFTVDGNGKIEYGTGDSDVITSGSVKVEFNELAKAVITATPDTGYRVSKVTIDNGEPANFSENSYVYSTELTVTNNHTVSVVFSKNTYTLSVGNGNTDKIVWDKNTVEHGDKATLTITPTTGYVISVIRIAGDPVPASDYVVEDGKIVITHTVEGDTTAWVEYKKVEEVKKPADIFENEYFTITFKGELSRTQGLVILDNEGEATITAKDGYSIKIHDGNMYAGFEKEIVITETQKIAAIAVSIGNGADDKAKVNVDLKIVVDITAPKIDSVSKPGWSRNDVIITGKVSDAVPGSGVSKVLFSTEEWTEGDPLPTNEATLDGNSFSFVCTGEQNQTYYIYAVDFAGNVSEVASTEVKIDTTKPSIVKYEVTNANNAVENVINFLTFGIFCKDSACVTVYVEDTGIAAEGAMNVTLHLGSGENRKAFQTVEVVDGKAVFTLTANEFNGELKKLSANVLDAVGNNSGIKPPSNLSNEYMLITADKPMITITPIDYVYQKDNAQWYSDEATYEVTIQDTISGIGSVEIFWGNEELTHDLNGKPIDWDYSTLMRKELTFVVSSSQLKGEKTDGAQLLKVVAVNNAKTEEVATSEDAHRDITKPGIVNYEITKKNDGIAEKVINFLTFGIFFNEQVEITVTAEDTNASSGLTSITLYLTGAEGVIEETLPVEDGKATFTVTKDALPNDFVYAAQISAIATDNVGHSTEKAVTPADLATDMSADLMLETVKPTIEIKPTTEPDYSHWSIDKLWYAQDVKFDIHVEDLNSGLYSVKITVNDWVFEETYYQGEKAKTSMTYTVNTADATRNEDGSYLVEVTVVDNAGNISTDSYTVYKDDSRPYISKFEFAPENYAEGDGKADVVATTYGYFFKENTKVTIYTRDDNGPSSGLSLVTYFTVDIDGNISEKYCADTYGKGYCEVHIDANFKGQIYAMVEDKVRNFSGDPIDDPNGGYITPDGIIIENQEKHDSEKNHITFEVPETPFKTESGVDLYSGNVNVTMTVKDTYSGIRSISWAVKAPYDTANNQSGSVSLDKIGEFVEGSESGWSRTYDVNLVTTMSKTITINNNSNDIVLEVTMTDRAGNTTTEEIVLSIDKTDPVINIVYGEDEVHDEEYTDIFSTNRTATITITERNFNAADVEFFFTNTDGILPGVNLKDAKIWTKTANENPDLTTYVAVVPYTADGDYTFDISFKDRANNAANKIEQHKFTIDKTKPVVSVSYDNMSAQNGNYFKADRIATITIVEHNFDEKRVVITGTATDDGATVTFPVLSVWTNQGNNTYTATIAYTADAKYSFDIDFRDKASNKSDNYAGDTFYVDKTAPEITISGVKDQSANNGEVAPVIEVTDTNFTKDTVVITLDGVNTGKNVQYAGAFADITNGQTYTYEDFAHEKAVDDIYTLTVKLTDMAGNTTEKSIRFSANRFGSVYDLSDLKELLTKYLQSEEDLVFTETNVDSLNKGETKIKVIKNGTPMDLEEGKDYKVEKVGGDGEWSVYTYTVSKDLFADDGRYSLNIYSVDEAGNINENIDETKAAEISFGIDKTKPVVTPIDLENGKQYPVDSKKVAIEIKDNLVLGEVKIYLNGKEIEYTVEGESYIFDVAKSNDKQTVKIVAVDAAGNEQVVEVKGFLVNANIFVRWYNNTPLFVGSIIGFAALIAAAIAFIVFGKKKKK